MLAVQPQLHAYTIMGPTGASELALRPQWLQPEWARELMLFGAAFVAVLLPVLILYRKVSVMKANIMAVAMALLSILTYGLLEYRPAISWHIRIVIAKKLQVPSMPSTDGLVAELRAAARGRLVALIRAYVGQLAHSTILSAQEKLAEILKVATVYLIGLLSGFLALWYFSRSAKSSTYIINKV